MSLYSQYNNKLAEGTLPLHRCLRSSAMTATRPDAVCIEFVFPGTHSSHHFVVIASNRPRQTRSRHNSHIIKALCCFGARNCWHLQHCSSWPRVRCFQATCWVRLNKKHLKGHRTSSPASSLHVRHGTVHVVQLGSFRCWLAAVFVEFVSSLAQASAISSKVASPNCLCNSKRGPLAKAWRNKQGEYSCTIKRSSAARTLDRIM